MDLIQLLTLNGNCLYFTSALVRCESKNKHQENIVCVLGKTGLCLQDLLAAINNLNSQYYNCWVWVVARES